jgi:hypothetical protein
MTLAAPAAHAAAAGQVLFALGRVEIQRGGQTLAAARGVPVEVGDTITTGPTGLAQVRLKDGALLSLRYGSSMRVDEFQMPAAAPAPAPAVGAPVAAAAPGGASGGGRSVLRLLRGAFRTVTGLIGKNVNDAYRVVTPVATIGIRGTDYSAAYCSGDCGATPDGLYVGVSNGEIQLNNTGGELVLTNDQYGYVKDGATAPDQELVPPEVLETPIEPPKEDEDSGDQEESPPAEVSTTEAAPESGFTEKSGTEGATDTGSTQPEGDYELRPGTPGSFAFVSGGLKGSRTSDVYTDDSGALTGFLTDSITSIGTSQNVNQGADADTGLRWGRWSGGTASVGGSSLDLRSQSLHWIYAATPTAPALPISGSATYTLIGGTNPTDDAGRVGQLVQASLSADFLNQTVTSSLNLFMCSGDCASDPNAQIWDATGGTGSIASGTPLFSGTYSSVTVNGAAGSGAFSGFFTDGAAAAGLVYQLDGAGTTVSGAAAFAQQPAAAGQ